MANLKHLPDRDGMIEMKWNDGDEMRWDERDEMGLDDRDEMG